MLFINRFKLSVYIHNTLFVSMGNLAAYCPQLSIRFRSQSWFDPLILPSYILPPSHSSTMRPKLVQQSLTVTKYLFRSIPLRSRDGFFDQSSFAQCMIVVHPSVILQLQKTAHTKLMRQQISSVGASLRPRNGCHYFEN